jgi:putative hydrolase of the HAD superfamily
MIKAILFDLGRVLLDFDHRRACEALAQVARRPGVTAEEVRAFIFDTDLEPDYDRGRLSDDEFRSRVCRELDIAVSAEEFARRWADIFWDRDGIRPYLADLKARGYRLGLCSNTNHLHFAYVEREFASYFRPFDDFFLSFQMGVRKPEDGYFEQVREYLGRLGLGPAEAIFIDDLPANVEAARRHGFQVIQCQSFEQMREEVEVMLTITPILQHSNTPVKMSERNSMTCPKSP